MKSWTFVLAIACAWLSTTALAQRTDAAARDAAASCAACHGTNGVSAGSRPSLAGQPRERLVAVLREYKAGTRAGTVMPQLAKGYTDAQIDAIAAWFAERSPQ
jgi:cytochrome subunit of sulfide dehydrogenase